MFVASRVSRFVLRALALSVLTAGPAGAGSFLQETGGWQVISSTSVTTSRFAYDARGARTSADPYRKVESGFLAEYGLTRDVTLIFAPVTRDVALSGGAGVSNGRGLSSFEAGARWRLFDLDGQAVTFQAVTRAPGRSDPAFLFENRPRTEMRLGYGTPAIVNGKPGFVDGSIAWAKRRQEDADEVKLETTYGWWTRRDRLVLLQYFTTLYPGSGARQHKIQTSTVYKFNESWAFQLGSFFTRGGLSTRNERGTVLAVWRRF